MASSIAQIAKDKGNASFKSGNWADAVGHYSAALLADRTEPTYPLNRAAAYLRLGKYQDAERDCTTVLNLDSKNVKALFRRAQSRVALERFPEAEKDLLEAIRIEPANVAIKSELAVMQRRRLEAAQKSTSSKREPIAIPPLPSSSHPKTIFTPETSRSCRPTRNVPIEIVEPDEAVSPSRSSTDFLKPIHSRVLSHSPPSLPPSASASKPQPRVGAAIFRADGKHTILRTPSPSVPTNISSQAATQPLKPVSTAATPSTATSALYGSTPSPPLTHFAFSRDWNAIPTPQERYIFLTRIPPESLPALFKNSLEPEFLVSILHTFMAMVSTATNTTLSRYMSALPSIPRFDTIILFLSPAEKALASAVWDAIGADGDDQGRHSWGM